MRVKINQKALQALRESDAVAAELEKVALRIADRANQMLDDEDEPEGFKVGAPSFSGPGRTAKGRASVVAFTNHARYADAKRNILVRATFGGK
jgi:hypothetical protein